MLKKLVDLYANDVYGYAKGLFYSPSRSICAGYSSKAFDFVRVGDGRQVSTAKVDKAASHFIKAPNNMFDAREVNYSGYSYKSEAFTGHAGAVDKFTLYKDANKNGQWDINDQIIQDKVTIL